MVGQRGDAFYGTPRGAELGRGNDDYLILFEEGPNKENNRPHRTARRCERESLRLLVPSFRVPGFPNLWGEYSVS